MSRLSATGPFQRSSSMTVHKDSETMLILGRLRAGHQHWLLHLPGIVTPQASGAKGWARSSSGKVAATLCPAAAAVISTAVATYFFPAAASFPAAAGFFVAAAGFFAAVLALGFTSISRCRFQRPARARDVRGARAPQRSKLRIPFWRGSSTWDRSGACSGSTHI